MEAIEEQSSEQDLESANSKRVNQISEVSSEEDKKSELNRVNDISIESSFDSVKDLEALDTIREEYKPEGLIDTQYSTVFKEQMDKVLESS